MSKILIVDDMETNRELLKAVLIEDNEEYCIIEASSGKEAVRTIKENMPDIILLDIMMPDMDGFQVCKELKNTKDYSEIPVLFITAIENIEDKVKGFKLGAADYITKPINPEEVKARVATHLRIKKEVAENAIKRIIITCNHEMRQPLTAIAGYVDILLSEMEKDLEAHEMLTIVSEQTARIKKILDKIMLLETFVGTEYIKGSTMIDLKLDEDA